MTTDEMEEITGTNIDAICIDAEGLDSDILLSLSDEMWDNLKLFAVETVTQDLIKKMYEYEFKSIYYVDDRKHGQYHIFSKEKIDFKFKHKKYSPDEMQKVIQQQIKDSKLTL